MAEQPRVIKVVEPLPEVFPDCSERLLKAEFDTEMVVWAKGTTRAHHLDGLAAILLDACDGVTRSAAFIDEVAEVTGCEHETAAQAVDDAWRLLIGSGLVR